MRPIIMGAAGKSKRRIPKPKNPKKNKRPTSNTELDEPYTPATDITTMPA